MPNRWDEEGKVWDDDHGLLDEDQIARCARADEAEPLRSPIPTRMISNGEYMPVPQTDQQKRAEARVGELADSASRKLGVDRRAFLASTGGMAAALIAMNEVFGRFFDVDPIEMFEPAAYAQAGAPPPRGRRRATGTRRPRTGDRTRGARRGGPGTRRWSGCR